MNCYDKRTSGISFIVSLILAEGIYIVSIQESGNPKGIWEVGQYQSHRVAIEMAQRLVNKLNPEVWEYKLTIYKPDNMKWVITSTDCITKEIQRIIAA